jgi:hypothetical protein
MTAALALSAVIAAARVGPHWLDGHRDARARRIVEQIQLPRGAAVGEPLPSGLRVAVGLHDLRFDFRSSFAALGREQRARAFEGIEGVWLDAMLNADRPPIALHRLESRGSYESGVVRELVGEHWRALWAVRHEGEEMAHGATLYIDARLPEGRAMRVVNLIGSMVPIAGYAFEGPRGVRLFSLSMRCGCGRPRRTILVHVAPSAWIVREERPAASRAEPFEDRRREVQRAAVIAQVRRVGPDDGEGALRVTLRRLYCARASRPPDVREAGPPPPNAATGILAGDLAATANLAAALAFTSPTLAVDVPDDAPFGDGLRIRGLVREVEEEGCLGAPGHAREP